MIALVTFSYGIKLVAFAIIGLMVVLIITKGKKK